MPRRRTALFAGAIVAIAAILALGARALATHYHDDSLWANAVGSLGGTNTPGDFGYVFLPAANEVLEGRDPYMDPELFHGPPQAPYAYPPVLAWAVTPLALLPETVRGSFLPGVLFSLLLIASTVGALLLLDVRDWRCYPVALAYPVTLEAVEYGAVGPLLLLLLAVAWRYRDRAELAGAGAALAVVLKLFLWPLVLWLAFTGRARAALVAVASAAGLAFVSWAAIGFGGLREYPRLLEKLSDIEAASSYSAFAVVRAAGVGEFLAQAAVVAIGLAILGLAVRAARRTGDSQATRDRRSFLLVLSAALVLTPILWLHYLVLLLVPIALTRPRLSPLWLVPLAMTLFEALDWYRGWPSGDAEALTSVAVVCAVVFLAALRPRTRPAEVPRGAPARA